MKVSSAPLQVRLLILKKNKKKRTESIKEGKENPLKDMQARTKSPKHEGQNPQGEDQGWKRKKSPVDASPLLGRYQKDGKRKFTETNYEENGRKMKKRRLKLRRPMPKIRNSGVLSATVTSKTGGTAELTVWQRNMLLQKMVNGCNIARLNTNTRVVEVGKKRPMWWTGCCQTGY